MAEIVLGLASSRSPMVSIPSERWPLMGERDQRSTRLRRGTGQPVSYEELLAGASPDIAQAIAPEVWRRQYDAAQRWIATLSQSMADVDPDIVVIMGDDEEEFINADNRPGILVYRGESFLTIPRLASATPNDPVSSEGAWAWGDTAAERPVAAELAQHVIRYLLEADFDVAESVSLTPLKPEGQRLGHSFGWIHNRLLTDRARPIVPFILNVHYPLNQPSPKRCYELGRAVRGAIEAWSEDARVAVVTAGGLSVGVLEEEIDRGALAAMQSHDLAALTTLNRDWLQGATGEILLWAATAGAAEHLNMEVLDYLPAYRSPAGTGCGLAFARWT